MSLFYIYYMCVCVLVCLALFVFSLLCHAIAKNIYVLVMSLVVFVAWFSLFAAIYVHRGSSRASGARSWRQCRTVHHAHLGYPSFVWRGTRNSVVNVDHSFSHEIDNFARNCSDWISTSLQLGTPSTTLICCWLVSLREGLVGSCVFGNSSCRCVCLFLGSPTLKTRSWKASFFSRTIASCPEKVGCIIHVYVSPHRVPLNLRRRTTLWNKPHGLPFFHRPFQVFARSCCECRIKDSCCREGCSLQAFRGCEERTSSNLDCRRIMQDSVRFPARI